MSDRLLVPRRRVLVPAAISRRGFLAGVAATGVAGLALGACSGDDDGAAPTSTEPGGSGPKDEIVGGLSAVRFYGPYFAAGQRARVPLGLSDDEGLLTAALAPAEVGVSVRGPQGDEVASGITAPLHSEGLPRPYYAFEFVPETPGFYDIVLDTGEQGEVITQVQIVEADDPAVAAMVGPGDPMPAIQTPTVSDPRGVTPICTRQPPCDLHDVTAAEVLASGQPLALLVATPAFCQTVICGPVLDVLLDVLPSVPGLTAVHAEVYADPESNSVPPTPDDFAPVVTELGLAFEPVLYTVGADGIVRDRLDYIFGATEIRRALEDLVG